jgi:hypothetical protein
VNCAYSKVSHQAEAGAVHSQDLRALRAESESTLEQLRSAHRSATEGLKAEHTTTLDVQVKELEKKLSNQAVELKATQDDLGKAKASLEVANSKLENVKKQRDEAVKEAAEIAATRPPGQAEEIERLKRQLANASDEQAALRDTLAITKSTIEETLANHVKELEEAAKGRAEEVTRLNASHDKELQSLAAQKSDLLTKLSDLDGELATLKASMPTEPTTPKTNDVARATSPGVSEAELQQMHQAHNLKLHDMQAEHEKAAKAAIAELENALNRIDELQQDVTRKAMEIQYLEQEQEETQDQITRYILLYSICKLTSDPTIYAPFRLQEDLASAKATHET